MAVITEAPPTKQLTQDDIDAIRSLLPYDWRIQIGTSTGLTPRQVSDVFYLRTTNAAQNKLVWSNIKRILVKLKYRDLARKVQNRIDTTNVGL